jgi:signal transduction histidine kinase
MTSRPAWIACGLLVFAMGLSVIPWSPTVTAPAPRAGFVDLSHWNFARDGTARLAGEWLYFDGRWVAAVGDDRTDGVPARVPGLWPQRGRNGEIRADGFGTYALKLRLPAPPFGDTFAVDTGQMRSAYRLYADNKMIAEGGTPAASAADERINAFSSLGTLPPANPIVELRLEVSNHLSRYGGIFTAPSVGLASALERQRHVIEMLSLIMVGALLFAASYHFIFSGIVRGGRVHLWFGLLAALVGSRNFLIEPLARDIVPLIGQDWVWRLDLVVTSLCLPAAYWSLALSFRRYLSLRIGIVVTMFCVFAAGVVLAVGVGAGDTAFKAVEILSCATILYLAWAIVRAAWQKEKGTGLALAGLIFVAIAIAHDFLVAGSNAMTFGCIAFFVCISGSLTARSRDEFEKVVTRSAELTNVNAQLETAVGERTAELEQKIRELETQQIALEESRAAAVSANVTKSRFLANMSHELRTPLNAILGFSEIIFGRLFGDSAERYADYAADIHSSGRRLLALIDDVLDLSKIEAGKLALFDARLELGAQIDAAMRLVAAKAAAKFIRLVRESDAPIHIVADERALQQILVNLLTNAVKFTGAQGEVRVRAHREADGSTIVSVEDTGIGINPADMPHVLESFGQARHDIAATGERGTGLGLPIVKGLVEAHGGTLTIESEVDIGTKAIVSFPPERNGRNRDRNRAA